MGLYMGSHQTNVGMVELVDTGDLKSPALSIWVRIPLPTPFVIGIRFNIIVGFP